nr:immunoglobulin heavy chain junction region [Mus musculus]
EDSAVYFCATG